MSNSIRRSLSILPRVKAEYRRHRLRRFLSHHLWRSWAPVCLAWSRWSGGNAAGSNRGQHTTGQFSENCPVVFCVRCTSSLDPTAVGRSVLGAGLEPAFGYPERDFKSLASTHFAIRARCRGRVRAARRLHNNNPNGLAAAPVAVTPRGRRVHSPRTTRSTQPEQTATRRRHSRSRVRLHSRTPRQIRHPDQRA